MCRWQLRPNITRPVIIANNVKSKKCEVNNKQMAGLVTLRQINKN